MSTSDPLVGQVLDGRYRVQRKLARGGMATVYLADDLRLTRVVAVKVMHEGLGDDQDFAAKFDREARAAARLSHPNVVSVFDQGRDRGRPYIVMEYVEGRTLRHLITAEAPLDPLRALELLLPVTAAVAAAHEAGLIHRDIKPENVLLADRGPIKVADFGLARAISAQTATATGMLIGTVSYIAPELVTHGKADARCDVYALGVILFELLTGTKPHTGDSPIQVAYSHVHNAIPAPSGIARAARRDSRNGIPPYLDALVTTAATRRPADRPLDARVLLSHLRQARDALARGVLDDPALTERMRRATLDPANDVTEAIPTLAPSAVPALREPTLRFTPSTPISPGFPDTADGMPYYDAPLEVAPAGRPVRPRKRWPALVAALLGLVLATSGIWYVAWGRYVPTPDLRSLNRAQASAGTLKAGLVAVFAEDYSEEVAAGLVVRTDPAFGDRIVAGGELRIVLSKGPERYPVPALRGLTIGEATDALTRAHLVVGTLSEGHDDSVEVDRVVKASVKAGSPVKPGTLIDLTVSLGPAPVALANWTNKPLADAQKALAAAGLVVKVVKQSYSETVKKGSIIAQDPPAGEVHRGDVISVEVSKGPPLVVVPNVRGKGVSAAKRILTDAGFRVRVQYKTGVPLGLVYSTDPGGGARAPKGSLVTIHVV